MKRLRLWAMVLFSVLALSVSHVVIAQTESPPEETTDEKAEASKQANEEAAQKKEQDESSKANREKSSFNPTEEISEDLSVPFPVDI